MDEQDNRLLALDAMAEARRLAQANDLEGARANLARTVARMDASVVCQNTCLICFTHILHIIFYNFLCIYVYMHIYIYMYVCMYVYMHVCIYVCMWVFFIIQLLNKL